MLLRSQREAKTLPDIGKYRFESSFFKKELSLNLERRRREIRVSDFAQQACCINHSEHSPQNLQNSYGNCHTNGALFCFSMNLLAIFKAVQRRVLLQGNVCLNLQHHSSNHARQPDLDCFDQNRKHRVNKIKNTEPAERESYSPSVLRDIKANFYVYFYTIRFFSCRSNFTFIKLL